MGFVGLSNSWRCVVSMMFLAAMMMAQAPAAATQPAQPAQPATVKAKPKQVCEYLEITGSRAKRRVCRDADGNLDLGPGVSNSAFGKAKIELQGTPSTGSPGGSN
jgi:hypothetical protein